MFGKKENQVSMETWFLQTPADFSQEYYFET